MARNAMPPPGDTDGAVRSDEAGEAPHSVVVLPATSDLSSTLRPLVERERRERGDEDGAVGVAGRGMAASSTKRFHVVERLYIALYNARASSRGGCRALQLYSALQRSTALQLYSALHSTSSTPSLSTWHEPCLHVSRAREQGSRPQMDV